MNHSSPTIRDPQSLLIIKHMTESFTRRSVQVLLGVPFPPDERRGTRLTYSRELPCIITPLGEPSNVIGEQDGRHKEAFLQNGAQHFVTLNAWTSQ